MTTALAMGAGFWAYMFIDAVHRPKPDNYSQGIHVLVAISYTLPFVALGFAIDWLKTL